MRVYLCVIDETSEAALALRFAARRASKTGGRLHILALVEPAGFVAWAGVQDTIAEEARNRAEALVTGAAGTIAEESGLKPAITVRQGEGVKIVRAMLDEVPDLAALVLGASASGAPGPLVDHFTGPGCGTLPCPIMVIPGSLSNDDIDRLS